MARNGESFLLAYRSELTSVQGAQHPRTSAYLIYHAPLTFAEQPRMFSAEERHEALEELRSQKLAYC